MTTKHNYKDMYTVSQKKYTSQPPMMILTVVVQFQ